MIDRKERYFLDAQNVSAAQVRQYMRDLWLHGPIVVGIKIIRVTW